MTVPLLDTGQIKGAACIHIQEAEVRVDKSSLEESWHFGKATLFFFFKAEKV